MWRFIDIEAMISSYIVSLYEIETVDSIKNDRVSEISPDELVDKRKIWQKKTEINANLKRL